MIKRSAVLALLVINALNWSGAAALTTSDEAVRDAALQWLKLVDSGRYEEAASQSSQEVRSFEQWINRFKSQREALGVVHQRQCVEVKRTFTLSGIPDVWSYNIIQFRTSFDRKPGATEMVTIAKIGCCWEIFGYSITEGRMTGDEWRARAEIPPTTQLLNRSTTQLFRSATEFVASEIHCRGSRAANQSDAASKQQE